MTDNNTFTINNVSYTLRPIEQTDRSFVFDSWRRSFRRSPFARTLTNDAFFEIQKQKMEFLVNNSNTLICCHTNEPDIIVGFVCHDKREDGLTVVHYLNVKYHYRRQGIARRMLASLNPSVPVVFTDISDKFLQLRSEHNLPYVTARELEYFYNQNPNDPMAAFTDWMRAQYYINQSKRNGDNQ